LESLDADQVRAWTDAVGPSFMAFIGFTLVIVLLIVPLLRRDKKEGGNKESDLSLYDRLARLEPRVEILWDERKDK